MYAYVVLTYTCIYVYTHIVYIYIYIYITYTGPNLLGMVKGRPPARHRHGARQHDDLQQEDPGYGFPSGIIN